MFSKKSSLGRSVMISGIGFVITGLVTIPLASQDEPEGPYPILYLIKNKVDAEKYDDYQSAIEKIVTAHKQHDSGNNWAAFSPMFGSSDPVYYYFLPVQKLGEIDDWIPNMRVVADIHGNATTTEIFRVIGESTESRNMILMYSPQLSNPSPDWTGAVPNFVYHVHSKVDPARVPEHLSLIQKMATAHKDHEKGLHWAGYTVFAGGSAAEYHFFLGLDKMGEMDEWPMGPEVLEAKYGSEETKKLLKAMREVSKASDQLLVHSPNMSNLITE
jgi:hypothetical protein